MLLTQARRHHTDNEVDIREGKFGLPELQCVRVVKKIVYTICIDTNRPVCRRLADAICAFWARLVYDVAYPRANRFGRLNRSYARLNPRRRAHERGI